MHPGALVDNGNGANKASSEIQKQREERRKACKEASKKVASDVLAAPALPAKKRKVGGKKKGLI